MAEPQRTRYEIRDASGSLVAVHVRVDGPAKLGDTVIAAGEKAVFWRGPNGEKDLAQAGLSLVELPLFGIERYGKEQQVVITEGEKAATALQTLGVPAVGTVTGASATPSRRALGDLGGKYVVLWPDNDGVGRDHMLRVASNLKGIAAQIRWVVWKDAPEHADAFDYLFDEDGARTRFEPFDLIDAAEEPPSLEPTFELAGTSYVSNYPANGVTMRLERLHRGSGGLHGELRVYARHPGAPRNGNLVVTTFNVSSDTTRNSMAKSLGQLAPMVKVDWRDYLERFCVQVLEAEREGQPITEAGGKPATKQVIQYDVYPLLPRKKGTILFAPPGTGKSYLAAGVVVTYTTGIPLLPDWVAAKPGKALVLDWEDDRETWENRVALVAAGLGIESPTFYYSHPLGSLTDDPDRISRFCDEYGVGLIVIDSFGMAAPTNREGGDANDTVLRLFKALNVIGRTALVIDHVTKADAGKDRSSGPYGSQYKTALARQTWELRKTVDEEETVFNHVALYDAKRNNGGRKATKGIAIQFSDTFVRFDYEDIGMDGANETNLPVSQRIERALTASPLTYNELRDLLFDVKETTLRSELSRGMSRERFVKLPDGRYANAAREYAA